MQTSLPDGWLNRFKKQCEQSMYRETLKELWNGVITKKNWELEADIFLCFELASFFNGNPVAMDEAYRQSGLFSEKWDKPYYGEDRSYGTAIISMITVNYQNDVDFDSQNLDEIIEKSIDGWPDPVPFNVYSHLPKFPLEAMLGPCGEMTGAISRHCQVDTGLAGTTVLSAISTAIGGKVIVNLGTHKEPTNIYAIGIVGSGNRKTEVHSQSAEPIYAYQRECQENMAHIIREAESKRRILEKRLDKLQKEAAAKDNPIERDQISKQCSDVLTEMEANPVPKKPVFVVDDITIEALGQVMADNGECMGILSAEGGIFKIISGLYNNGQANMDLFLKAHSGDFWSNSRIGRESKMMEHPTLTLGLAVQPDVIEEIGRNSEFRGRGLSARFLYSLCRSRAGYRTRQSEPIPPHVKAAYNRKITALMSLNKKYELTLTPKAQALWDSFYDLIEKLLRPGAELENLVDWGSKLPGSVARIAGLLHFADSADDFPGNIIETKTVFLACEIGWYYLNHAQAVFGLMKEDSTVTDAKKILNYIKLHNPVEFKGRDLFNHTNCQSMQDIQPGLNLLLERFYIREIVKHVDEKRKGRPEAVSYEVNPKIFSIA